jgi:polar amino acid transport system substrate-binding protein
MNLYRIAVILLTALPEMAMAAPVLKLQIVQRPPYLMVTHAGAVSGIAVEPTVAAFKSAGIPVEWEEVPALRQLLRLKLNEERVCSVGWYKTREREQFAKFTNAVSQDSPWAGVANIKFETPKDATVSAILANPRTTVLLKSGYVYGEFLDQQIAAMKARRESTSDDMPLVFKMVAYGRAQITFAPREEIQYYLDTRQVSATDIRIITFSEMPIGYKRYLMCSRLVEDDLIRRFNAALPRI